MTYTSSSPTISWVEATKKSFMHRLTSFIHKLQPNTIHLRPGQYNFVTCGIPIPRVKVCSTYVCQNNINSPSNQVSQPAAQSLELCSNVSSRDENFSGKAMAELRAALNDCCGRHVTVKSNYLGCFIETTFFVRFIKMAFQPSSERTQILVHCFAVRQEDWSIEVSNIFQNRNTKQINSRTKGTTILFLFMYIKGPLIIPVRKRKGTDYARHLTNHPA